jgi:hypothetical protein
MKRGHAPATDTVALYDVCIRLFYDRVIEEENAAREARLPKPRYRPYPMF